MPPCNNASCKAKQTSLDQQRRIAWAKYYAEHSRRCELSQRVIELMNLRQYRNPAGVLERPAVLPQHITNELWDMANELNREFTCPVCFELLEKDTIHIAWCGHLLCKGCYANLPLNVAVDMRSLKKKCPTCRAEI